MKISVIIPAFNEEKNLDKCLTSLQNQKIKPFEVLVIDNNSKDKTVEIAKKFGCRVVREKKQGISFARNKGFDEAYGDVILRTDADTVLPSDWIERMQKHFENPKVGRVTGPAIFYKSKFNPLFLFLVFWINDILGYQALFGPNFGIRKDIWMKVRNSVHTRNDLYHEDLDLAIHTARLGTYKRDLNLKVTTSHRRAVIIQDFLVDYPLKWLRTAFHPQHLRQSRWAWWRN